MENNINKSRLNEWKKKRLELEYVQKKINFLEKELRSNASEEKAKHITTLALQSNALYYSEDVEKYYLRLAHATMIPNKHTEHIPNTFLHVMTTSYLFGGHTRIVERWISSSPAEETHSVVLLNQIKNQLPPYLEEVITENGGILNQFTGDHNITIKANELRHLAQEFDYVILHHHMDDPIPLMAFGVPEFNRPVINFNHAGHRFWIGRNATDLVIDIEESQQTITLDRRGIRNSMIINLPHVERSEKIYEKKALREVLGLPSDKQIIISMASAYKYKVLFEYNYPSMLENILTKKDTIIVIIIGVTSGENKHWVELENKFPHRLFLLGTLPHTDTEKYLQAADLYLDSYPYNSFTSLLDAITIGNLPALTLKKAPLHGLPFVEECDACAKSVNELVEKTLFYLNNPDGLEFLYRDLQARIHTYSSTERFQKEIHNAYKRVKQIPKNKNRYKETSNTISEWDILSYAINEDPKEIISDTYRVYIGKLRLINIVSAPNYFAFTLFGIPIYSRHFISNRWRTYLFKK